MTFVDHDINNMCTWKRWSWLVQTLEFPIFDKEVFHFSIGYSNVHRVQHFLLPYKYNGIPNRDKIISSLMSHSVTAHLPKFLSEVGQRKDVCRHDLSKHSDMTMAPVNQLILYTTFWGYPSSRIHRYRHIQSRSMLFWLSILGTAWPGPCK